tara:strand:- start:3723 stop:5408 length:1686 start_codon:yes stop_codon:yes gene_type:complete
MWLNNTERKQSNLAVVLQGANGGIAIPSHRLYPMLAVLLCLLLTSGCEETFTPDNGPSERADERAEKPMVLTKQHFNFAPKVNVTRLEQTHLQAGVNHIKATLDAGEPMFAWSVFSPPVTSTAKRITLKETLTSMGLSPRVNQYPVPGATHKQYFVLAVESFASQQEARAWLAQQPALEQAGFKVSHSAYEPSDDHGKWVINILHIQPDKFTGNLISRLYNQTIHQAGTVLAIARSANATAAINANFFVMHDKNGVVGDPSGLLIEHGKILSEPLNQRPAMAIFNKQAQLKNAQISVRFFSPDTMPYLKGDGQSIMLTGINRRPGIGRNCGLSSADSQQLAMHDHTCHALNELILLTPEAGFLPPEESVSLVLTHNNTLQPYTGQTLEQSQQLLVATGTYKARLNALKLNAAKIELVYPDWLQGLQNEHVVAIEGAPALLRNGEVVHNELSEGWPWDKQTTTARKAFNHAWLTRRNPRTAIGETAAGDILLITVDGRQPGYSAGMSINEMRRLMAGLGAVNAINLDGGGSTTMVVNDEVVNSPSSANRTLRNVGNALLIMP